MDPEPAGVTSWHRSLPPADASVPCGTGTHAVRWEAGRLTLPAHPDAEAEMVLGALGGDKPGCVTLAETWARHASDLTVLAIGPRGAADRVTVSRDDAAELARRELRRAELLGLFALGPAFQFRLAGAVAAAWADASRAAARASHRPELTAALTGRLGPAAHEWLDIDPAAVTVTPHEGPGWGSLRVTGTGTARRLRAAVAVSWLSTVWACGLAVAGGHLVVAVEQPGYPRARVLALAAPDADPVLLDVQASGDDADGLPRWTA
jgi:hypothetical protein